jgi:hypothetical protein
MMKMPRNHGKGWTPQQVATLHRLASEGLSAAAIASRMGRTRAGVVKWQVLSTSRCTAAGAKQPSDRRLTFYASGW